MAVKSAQSQPSVTRARLRDECHDRQMFFCTQWSTTAEAMRALEGFWAPGFGENHGPRNHSPRLDMALQAGREKPRSRAGGYSIPSQANGQVHAYVELCTKEESVMRRNSRVHLCSSCRTSATTRMLELGSVGTLVMFFDERVRRLLGPGERLSCAR